MVCASSLDKEIKELGYGGNKNAAKAVGALVAKRALEANIKAVVSTEAAMFTTAELRNLPTEPEKADWNSKKRRSELC